MNFKSILILPLTLQYVRNAFQQSTQLHIKSLDIFMLRINMLFRPPSKQRKYCVRSRTRWTVLCHSLQVIMTTQPPRPFRQVWLLSLLFGFVILPLPSVRFSFALVIAAWYMRKPSFPSAALSLFRENISKFSVCCREVEIPDCWFFLPMGCGGKH